MELNLKKEHNFQPNKMTLVSGDKRFILLKQLYLNAERNKDAEYLV